jgi:ABC-type dipeptide/oligopeptide/nickel transport system permease component
MVLLTGLIVGTVTFLIIHAIPGNPFSCLKNPAACQHEARVYGLDAPLSTQYRTFLWNLLHLNLGYSYVNQGVQVTPLLVREAGTSFTLGVCAVAVMLIVGIPVGVAAAVRQNTWLDYLLSGFVVFGYSLPNFVLATALIVLVGILLPNWSGLIGWGSPLQVPLPALALGLPYAAVVGRLTRAGLLDVLRQDYVRTAWAKGLKGRAVIFRHALRNGLIPVVSVGGPLITSVVTGSVVIESIFGIPGLGKEFVDSLLTRDYNIVVGLYMFYAVLLGLANLGVDLCYPLLDPEIRYQ